MRLPLALLLAPLLLQEAPAPKAPPPPPPAAKVIAAVDAAAAANAALPEDRRAKPGALADLYVRRAAEAADGDARAFLVGLGHAVDPGGTLARHPLCAPALAGAETPEGARARVAVLGRPALRGRNDLLLHFAVSAALRAVAGEEHAERLGVAKEMADARGGSGFSFADLMADLAGIRFAERLLDGKEGAARLRRVAEGFRGDDWLPDPSKEPEGLDEAEFRRRFGSVSDERFLEKRRALVEAIEALPVHRPPASGR